MRRRLGWGGVGPRYVKYFSVQERRGGRGGLAWDMDMNVDEG